MNGRRALCLLLFLTWGVSASHAESIPDYQTDLRGRTDGSLLVEERILYDFGDLQRHGIYRDIPITVPAPWGGRRTLKISGVSVERDREPTAWAEESVSGDAGPMLRLRIGDPDRTLSGRHTYSLRYQVADALLPTGDRDAFRWNAIGTGWSIPIHSAKVRLDLPTELRGHAGLESDFFTGPWGATYHDGKSRWDPEMGILEVTAGPLAPHEGVTVEVSFPVGTIPATAHPAGAALVRQALPHLWGWPLMLLGLGLGWTHWRRTGRDPTTGPIMVRYEPPKGLEAVEAGLLIDQSFDDSDLTGTVIELARDGWLRIEHPKDEGFIRKLVKGSRVTLESLRPRDQWGELPPYKRHLMECFFCRGERFSPGGTEGASVAGERKRWLDKAKARIHERGVEHGLFPENPRTVRIKYVAGAAVLGLLLLLLGFWGSDMTPETLFMSVASLVFVGIVGFTGYRVYRGNWGAGFRLLASLVVGVLVVSQFLPIVSKLFVEVFPGWGAILVDPLAPMIVLAVCLLLIAWQMPKRTPQGARARSELLGFRKFMERAEEPRLRRMLEQDPVYFERTLPFAALFGLLEDWSARFEGLAAIPTWYDGGSFQSLGSDMNHLGSSGLSSSPPSQSGGSSGGGSSSGGGGGGGGGRSW